MASQPRETKHLNSSLQQIKLQEHCLKNYKIGIYIAI